MKRQSFHGHINALIVSMALGLLMVAQSFAATGGSFYTSQLGSIGTGNTSFGNTNGSSVGYTVANPLTQAIDLQAGDWDNSMAKVTTATQAPSFMEWDLPSGTFNAQTVIAYRNTEYVNFTTGSPWHLEIFSGGTWTPISGVSGAGANNDTTIAMGNSSITNGTKIRAIYDSLNTFSSTFYMSMGEILVLPNDMHKVTNSYTASASSAFSGSFAASLGIDNQEGGGTFGVNRSWVSAAGDSNAWFNLSFTSPTTLDALLLSKWNGERNAVVDIYRNGTSAFGYTNGTLVASGVDLSNPNAGINGFNVFKFDSTLTGVTDLSLKFISGGRPSDGAQGLAEITPFVIPEPTAAVLLGLGGVLLLRNRRTS